MTSTEADKRVCQLLEGFLIGLKLWAGMKTSPVDVWFKHSPPIVFDAFYGPKDVVNALKEE